MAQAREEAAIEQEQAVVEVAAQAVAAAKQQAAIKARYSRGGTGQRDGGAADAQDLRGALAPVAAASRRK